MISKHSDAMKFSKESNKKTRTVANNKHMHLSSRIHITNYIHLKITNMRKRDYMTNP